VYNLDGTLRTDINGNPIYVEGASVVPGGIAAWEAIRTYKPSLVISTGTAGGVKGITKKGQIYVATGQVTYHDRLIDFRLPGDDFHPNNYQAYGICSTKVLDCPNMRAELQLGAARVSSGSSFDPCQANVLQQFVKNGAAIKEMEAAAIAEVAQILGVPFVAIKGITDYIHDVPENKSPTNGDDEAWNKQFEKELAPVSETIAATMVKVVQFMLGKHLSQL